MLNPLEPKQEDGTPRDTDEYRYCTFRYWYRLAKSGARMLFLCCWYAELSGYGPATVSGVGIRGPTLTPPNLGGHAQSTDCMLACPSQATRL